MQYEYEVKNIFLTLSFRALRSREVRGGVVKEKEGKINLICLRSLTMRNGEGGQRILDPKGEEEVVE